MFHMQRQRRLPEEHARFYSAEISLALNFLHEKGNSRTRSKLRSLYEIFLVSYGVSFYSNLKKFLLIWEKRLIGVFQPF